ncbi:aspartate/glutamate racemase family protein [Variovorax sp. 770b2]|uniref:maleate cis-trans isomerase family protein n=1 Tax=Variovorax sp. 770b2 TaxID=1566271 RepID=UPI0008F3101B|nr:aspartate/glutamate racemase family protein [Variovorax sp. 770b2]SFP30837.1 maleate isomerase [Variovorax sp. 770b2]
MSRTLIGMLTPSSNTALEPVTSAMLAGLPNVSAHYGRFRVTEIALSSGALSQFDDREILAAAELLSHARCQVIGWNGTSAGWLGFEADERLCAAIARETGALACTSVLALNEALKATGVRRLGLVSPYRADVQAAIVRNYAASGIQVVAERHLGLQDNFSFSEVSAEEIRDMVRAVMTSPLDGRPEAVAIFCTNLFGAPLVAELEAEFGVPVYDTVATVVWKALRLAGVDTRPLAGWGRLFLS